MKLPLYIDDGSGYTEINYKSFEISNGYQNDKSKYPGGANKYVLKVGIDEPFIPSGTVVVPYSEAPCAYGFSTWNHSADFEKGEITYYGWTYLHDYYGYGEYEFGGHGATLITYEPEVRELYVSELIGAGRGVICTYEQTAVDHSAPAGCSVITMYEPNMPYDEVEAHLGDTIRLINDVHETGVVQPDAILGEKRLIADENTYRVEYTIRPLESKQYKLPVGYAGTVPFWDDTNKTWVPVYVGGA